jgi:hypothetical protein
LGQAFGNTGNVMLVAGPLQFPKRNLKMGIFKKYLGAFGFFLYGMSQGSFDSSASLLLKWF